MNSIQLNSIFIYIESFYLLICSEHQIAISLSQIQSHLKSHFSTNEIKEKKLEYIFKNINCKPLLDSFKIIKDQEPIHMIKELEDPKSGFECLYQECNFISLSNYNIKRHIRTEHSIKGNQDSYIKSCLIQSLIPEKYLFRVQESEVSSYLYIYIYIY